MQTNFVPFQSHLKICKTTNKKCFVLNHHITTAQQHDHNFFHLQLIAISMRNGMIAKKMIYKWLNCSNCSNICFANAKSEHTSNCYNTEQQWKMHNRLCQYVWEWMSLCVHGFVTGNSIKISSNLICVYSLLKSTCNMLHFFAIVFTHKLWTTESKREREVIVGLLLLNPLDPKLMQTHLLHAYTITNLHWIWCESIFFRSTASYSNHYQWHRVPHTHRK